MFVVAFLLIAVTTVIGNILVILAVFSNRRLQNPANFLMVNLAVSDFFQGALTMPMRLAEVLNTSEDGLIRCDWVISLTILFHSASNFNLALIALDRFIAVSRPFAYANVMKTSSYKIVIGVTWFCCLVLASCPVVGWRKDFSDTAGTICRYNTTLTEEYIILYVFVVDLAPLVIMLVAYTYIFRTTRRQIRKIRAQEIAVKHAAINQACDSRRSSDAIPDTQAARSGIADNHSTCSFVRASLSQPEEKRSAETSNNNNNIVSANQTIEAKPPLNPQNSANEHASISTSRGDLMQPEPSNSQELSHSSINCVKGNGESSNRKDSKERMTPGNSNGRNVPLSTTRTRKATRTVLAIMGFFIVLCLPITLIDVIELWWTSCGQIPPAVITIALCMVASNSSVNVFVYGGYNTDYSTAYWRIWHRVKDFFLGIFASTKITAQSAARTVSST